MSNDPNEALRHHVSGAIERGEAEPIIGLPGVHSVNSDKKAVAEILEELAKHLAHEGDNTGLRLLGSAELLLEVNQGESS
jgi:hypothetical protein